MTFVWAMTRAESACCTDGQHTPKEDLTFPHKFARREGLPANKEALRKGVHPGSFIDLLVCTASLHVHIP